MSVGAYTGQRKLDPLELVLQKVVRHLTVLGTEFGSPATAENTPNH